MKEEDHNCIDLNQTKSHIKKHGLSIVKIESTSYLPSFAYSVGLKETYNHPEIICLGLKTQNLADIINDVAAIIKKEGSINLNREYDNIFQGTRAQFLNVEEENMEDYFGVAFQYYDSKDFKGLQLVWADPNNKFPWEEGFEEKFKYLQPLLDRNSSFKFREDKNLGIYTTRQWLEDKDPIIEVFHDEDGDWQFLTAENDIENGKLVALEQMILSDKTLNDVFDLEYGEMAVRDAVGGKWRRKMNESEEEE